VPTHLVVKNFERFQHYRDRNPPWIKLYGDVLVDLAFVQLPEAAQAQLIKLWILASQFGHPLPNDPKLLAGKIGSTGKFYLAELIAAGFIIPSDFASNRGDPALARALAKSSENATPSVRARFQSSEVELDTAALDAGVLECSPVALAIWCNRAVAEKWGEQPSPYVPANAVQLSDVLVAANADPAVVRLSIYRQCRESKRPHPPRAVNYFRPGIEDDLEQNRARKDVKSSGETPPPANGKAVRKPSAKPTPETPGDRSYADADAAFVAAGITSTEEPR
jgi:hypothetical protein